MAEMPSSAGGDDAPLRRKDKKYCKDLKCPEERYREMTLKQAFGKLGLEK
jgi:hypothetical protein